MVIISEREVAALIKLLPKESFIRQWVEYVARVNDAHVMYHVGVALGLLSQTIPPDLAIPFGKPIYGNIYVMCVGDSTMSRKNAAIDAGQRLADLVLPNNVGEIPGSPEGLIDALREKPQQILFWQEIASTLKQAQSGYMAPLKAHLTNAYDAMALGRRRANERGKAPTKSNPILHPRLSIIAATTPGFYEDSLDEVDMREGFTARFITFRAERERLVYFSQYNPERENELAAILKGYADPWIGLQTMPGRCTGLSPEAAKMWVAWLDEIEAKVRGAPTSMWTAGVARAPGHALKIALLLSWDYGAARRSDSAPWQVTDAELGPAIEIARWHVLSVQSIAESLAGDRDMRDRRRVLNVIGHKPTPFGRIVKEAKVMSRRAKELLQTLQDEGTIVSVTLEGAGTCYARGNGVIGDQPFAPTPLDGDAPTVSPTNPQPPQAAAPTPLD